MAETLSKRIGLTVTHEVNKDESSLSELGLLRLWVCLCVGGQVHGDGFGSSVDRTLDVGDSLELGTSLHDVPATWKRDTVKSMPRFLDMANLASVLAMGDHDFLIDPRSGLVVHPSAFGFLADMFIKRLRVELAIPFELRMASLRLQGLRNDLCTWGNTLRY